MKKRIAVLGAALALVMAVLVVQPASSDPAVVIKNSGLCGMPGAGPNGEFITGGLGIMTTNVGNDNKAMLKCKGSGITNLSGRGQSFSGFLCGLLDPQDGGLLVTANSHAAVSASGVGTLTCTFTK